MNVTLEECATFLRENDNYIIFCHSSPDADTLGSGIALCRILGRIGKSARVFCNDDFPNRLKFMAEYGEIIHSLPSSEYTPISVDVATPAMLKGLDAEFVSGLVFELSIDHHAVNTVKAKRLYLDDHAPAVGEIVAFLAKKLIADPFDKEVSSLLYAAITSDSGSFRFSSTRPETMRITADIMESGFGYGVDFSRINRLIWECKSKGQLALEKDALDHIEFFANGKIAVVSLSDEVLALDYVDDGDLELTNHVGRTIKGVEVSVMIRRKGEEIKVSLRSNDYYDVASVAKEFGGGGHLHAAGCRFYTSYEDAKKTIIERLKRDFE